MRKLTKREKISLGLLLILGFSYLYIQFLVVPQHRKMGEVRAELDTVEAEAEKVESYSSRIRAVEKELEKESERLDDALKRNFTKLEQEDIIMLVDSLAEESGLLSEGVTFERPTEEDVVEEKLELSTAELSFKGGYQTLNDFLDKLSSYRKRILVDRIAVDTDSDDMLTGTVYMRMYSLENVVEETESLFSWDKDSSYFASNPFSPFSSYIEAMRRQEAEDSSNDSSGGSAGTGSSTSPGSPGGSYMPYYPSVPSTGTTTGSTSSSSSSGGSTSSGGSSSSGSVSGGTSGSKNPSPSNPETPSKPSEPQTRKTIVDAFENESYFFYVGTPREDVVSNATTSTDRTEGNKSLSLKYNFLKERRYSAINIGFVKERYVSEKHSKISLDVKPIMRAPHGIRLVIKDSRGKYYDLGLSEDLNWSGWKTLSIETPSDAEFPIAFQRIYIESKDYEQILLGDVLLDNLQMTE